MASLVDSARSESVETSVCDEFNSGSLSAIFHCSSARTASTVTAALPTPPQQPPPPPPPPPPPASSVLEYQLFFDPISYLDSATPSWPRALVHSVSVADFPSVAKAHSADGAGVNSLDEQAGTAGSVPRSSKKRTRSSRRAPTTVLATDTSNFRSMVQQFTGPPSSPFDAVVSADASSSPLLGGSRFDLFGSSGSAVLGSSSSPEPPPFLRRRPFPQLKLVRVHASSTTNPAINYRPSANNIQSPSHELGFGSSMLSLQSLLHAKSTTAPPAKPVAASCSTKAQIS